MKVLLKCRSMCDCRNESQYCLFRSGFNPYRAGTELTRFNYVNIMAADALAPYVARTSAAMILVM